MSEREQISDRDVANAWLADNDVTDTDTFERAVAVLVRRADEAEREVARLTKALYSWTGNSAVVMERCTDPTCRFADTIGHAHSTGAMPVAALTPEDTQ